MYPSDVGAIDLMIGFPSRDAGRHYDNLRAMAKDAESQTMAFPAEYMFKDVPNQLDEGCDPIAETIEAMDRNGVAVGMVSLGNESTRAALERFPSRFVPSLEVDPNDIGEAVRLIRDAYAEHGIKAVRIF